MTFSKKYHKFNVNQKYDKKHKCFNGNFLIAPSFKIIPTD